MRTLIRISSWLTLIACAEVAPVVVATPKPEAVVVSHPAAPTLRLPAGVTPRSYELAATVLPGGETASATVRIRAHFDAPTDLIWLNATNLTFTDAHLEAAGIAPIAATAKAEGEHFVGLTLAKPFGPGEATIVVSSRAIITARQSEGLISFVSANETYVYSQFEPIGARKLFACFDEPGFKVPWQVTLTVPKALTALSNTNAVDETFDGALKTIRFAQTKPLPSYLVAMVVGPFDVVDAGVAGQNKTPVRIVVAKGQGARTAYAVANVAEAVERLETYFGSPMPFEKIDFVGLASPAGFDGMENPGLITFDEGSLLAGIQGDSILRQRHFITVLVHELAHMWFGDWVTMKWWNDVWLNEAFAEWLQDRVLGQWHPEWGGELDRVEEQNRVMGADAMVTSRKIRQPIASHDDIRNAFDSITYGKGQMVLNMFETWLTPAVFQKGIQRYLAKQAWGNADVNDFLAAMREVSGRDVSGPFSSFIDQVGMPLVTAKLDCAAGVKLTLSQKRFVPLGSVAEPQLWQVPVCVRWPSGQKCVLLDAAEKTFELESPRCPAWVLPNAGMVGFYRSAPVDPVLVGNAALTPSEQFGAVSDMAAAADIGELSLIDVMKVMPVVAKSPHRQIAEQALHIAEQVDLVLPVSLRPKLAAWVQANLGARARAMGLSEKPGESDDDRLLRRTLTGGVGTMGNDRSLQREAVRLVNTWLKDRTALSLDTLTVVLPLSAWSNDAKLFEALVAAARVEKDSAIRRWLTNAIGSFRDPALAARARALIFDPSLSYREVFSIIGAQARSPETASSSYEWVKSNYDALTKRLPPAFESALVSFGSTECTERRKADVEAFFKERMRNAVGGAHQYAQTMEELDQCIAWRNRQQPLVVKFFTK